MADLEDMDDGFGAAAEPKKKAPTPPRKPVAAVAAPEPEPEAPTPAELKQPALIAQPAPAVPNKVGIVKYDITILWQKRMIKLRAGTEVSDDAYGPNAYNRFEQQGVAMDEKIARS